MKARAALLLCLLLSACAQTSYLYYGDSSHAYYKAVKHATAQSVADYKASLERVFDHSAYIKQPVPPGLYCDYAMLLIAEKDYAAARAYLLREKSCWPESALLVDYLLQRYGLEP